MNAVPIVHDPAETQTLAHVRGFFFPRIVVGRGLAAYRGDIRAAILAHELGHIYHRHTLKRLLAVFSFSFRHMIREARRHEMEADLYAASLGYGRQLTQLYDPTTKAKRYLPDESAESRLIRRIGHLKQPAKLYRIRRILAAQGDSP